MSERRWMVLAAAAVVVVGLAVLAPAVSADSPESTEVTDSGGIGGMLGAGMGPCDGERDGAAGPRGKGRGPGGMLLRMHASLVAVTADVLGMDKLDVLAALKGGGTIAELAEEKGIEPQLIVDAVVELRAERLAEAVENGRLTQEEADKLLEVIASVVTRRINEPFEPLQGRDRPPPARQP